jgi:hypothetical protein
MIHQRPRSLCRYPQPVAVRVTASDDEWEREVEFHYRQGSGFVHPSSPWIYPAGCGALEAWWIGYIQWIAY